MRPSLSYTIWFSQRTGSTLLCRALASTGVAGHPGEHLYAEDLPALYARHGVDGPDELRTGLWQTASTPNGVLGLKHSMFEPWFGAVLGALADIEGHDGSQPGIWENAFPNGRHIFMTRRNKVRLAVSWWKAIQSQEWHRAYGAAASVADIADRYSFDAIDHLVAEATLREAAIQEFFAEGRIIPLTLVYEDFVARYQETVRDLLRWLGIEPPCLTIAPPAYERLSDVVSEDWVQRFRRDKQAGWANRGW
ncbi:MAG TPA: Stf0 family sulfotransferase [Alphaproteobacteria bacterium]|nr:Stf0 family sulfotransferase [Alphaproteobacteria bacterium]